MVMVTAIAPPSATDCAPCVCVREPTAPSRLNLTSWRCLHIPVHVKRCSQMHVPCGSPSTLRSILGLHPRLSLLIAFDNLLSATQPYHLICTRATGVVWAMVDSHIGCGTRPFLVLTSCYRPPALVAQEGPCDRPRRSTATQLHRGGSRAVCCPRALGHGVGGLRPRRRK